MNSLYCILLNICVDICAQYFILVLLQPYSKEELHNMMHEYFYSENNIIGLFILIVILANMKLSHKKLTWDVKLFVAITLSTFFIIILDIFMFLLNGMTGFIYREIIIILTMTYFLLNPIPFMAWALYVDFFFHRSERRLKKILPIIAIPAVISMLLIIFSLFNNGVFYIDSNNLYQRGNLFWLNAILYYSYFGISLVRILINRKNVKRKEYYTLLLFGVLPAIGGFIQTIYPNQTFLWLGVSLSSLIVFITIQNDAIRKDYLTDLYNRRELDRYLKQIIRDKRSDESILMIIIDLNCFKQINDNYGHLEGDRALINTANILTSTFRSEDFISRYAGDEFVVVLKLQNEEFKEEAVNRLQQGFNDFNNMSELPYELDFGIGYGIYDKKAKLSAEDFLIQIDKLMYEDKNKIKEHSYAEPIS